jgi:hypothetical protein
MDSVYLGEFKAHVVTKALNMNILGTAKCDHCRPDAALVKSECAKIKCGPYKCNFFVYNTLPLCVVP